MMLCNGDRKPQVPGHNKVNSKLFLSNLSLSGIIQQNDLKKVERSRNQSRHFKRTRI